MWQTPGLQMCPLKRRQHFYSSLKAMPCKGTHLHVCSSLKAMQPHCAVARQYTYMNMEKLAERLNTIQMMRKSPLAVRNSRWCPKGVSREPPTSDSSKAIRTRYLRQQCIELPLLKYAQIAEPKNLRDDTQKTCRTPKACKTAREGRRTGEEAPWKASETPKASD